MALLVELQLNLATTGSSKRVRFRRPNASESDDHSHLTETIDTTTPGGRLVFHVFGAVAQFEREVLIDRTKAGLAAARASGKQVGRPRLVTPERAVIARELRDSGMSLRSIAGHLRVSQATVARLLVIAS